MAKRVYYSYTAVSTEGKLRSVQCTGGILFEERHFPTLRSLASHASELPLALQNQENKKGDDNAGDNSTVDYDTVGETDLWHTNFLCG